MLLSGEYAVLDGAKALALPTRFGQSMMIKKTRGSDLIWEALDSDGQSWFKSTISIMTFEPVNTTDEEISATLASILKNAVRLNSEFLSKWNGFKVETQLEFPKEWGLGSSSTLTHLVAEWAGVHPLMLAFKCSNGSGYDVAAAGADAPIVFQNDEDSVSYTPIDYNPSFSKQLYFVYLGKKQNTNDQIKHYLKTVKKRKSLVSDITDITEKIIATNILKEFESLICKHEDLISEAIKIPTIKETSFSDYWGCVKSLGAWGGDFILATSDKSADETEEYFASKGLNTVVPFDQMILAQE